ncbi:MAG: YybH family protein [Chitinophagaceae bacterium]
MNIKKIALLSLLLTAMHTQAQTKDEKVILDILQNQTKAWNCGDLRGFMKGYWESDSLMFIGKNGITYGFEQTLANYRKNYPDMDDMGTLDFDIKKVEMISSDACFVLGKWHLKRPEKGDLQGHFTLLLRKHQGQWVIVADHSS